MNNRKIKIFILLILTIFIFLNFSMSVFAETEDKSEMDKIREKYTPVKKIKSFIINQINDLVNNLASQIDRLTKGNTIDIYVFGKVLQGQDYDQGLTIIKNDGPGKIFRQLYFHFRNLTIPFFLVIGAFKLISFFTFSANDAAAKSKIKKEFTPFLLSLLIIGLLPFIVDSFLMLDDIIVQSSYNFLTARGMLVEGDSIMVGIAEALYINYSFLIASLITLSLSVLWVIFMVYYYIRDITIALLFIFSPFVALKFSAAGQETLNTWLKTLAGAVFTRSVHSILLIMVFALVASGASALFVLTMLWAFLPITSTVKQFMGIESNVGGASSMAGAGMVMGLAMTAKGIAQKAGGSNELIQQGKALEKQADTLDLQQSKGYGSLENNYEGQLLSQGNQGIANASFEQGSNKVSNFANVGSGGGNSGAGAPQDSHALREEARRLKWQGRGAKLGGIATAGGAAVAGAIISAPLGAKASAMVGGLSARAGYSKGHDYWGGQSLESAEKRNRLESEQRYEQEVMTEIDNIAQNDYSIDFSNASDVENFRANASTKKYKGTGLSVRQQAEKNVLKIDKFPMQDGYTEPGEYERYMLLDDRDFGSSDEEQQHIKEYINAIKEQRLSLVTRGSNMEARKTFYENAPNLNTEKNNENMKGLMTDYDKIQTKIDEEIKKQNSGKSYKI